MFLSRAAITLISSLLSSLLACPRLAIARQFCWETLPVFFHGANCSGPISNEAVHFLAHHFDMVTIDKFQFNGKSHQESNIIGQLARIKEVNPNVTTIFYLNSVLDFPQYVLHQAMLANPRELMLHDSTGRLIGMNGGGSRGLDVFDFSSAPMRQLFTAACIQAVLSGVVDGIFFDRAVVGTPTENFGKRFHFDLTPEKRRAWDQGHLQVMHDVQHAIRGMTSSRHGEGGIVIANRAYGPPHDNSPDNLQYAMIEQFVANNASINALRLCNRNGRGVQAHGVTGSQDELAAFLIGAGHRALYGLGSFYGDALSKRHFLQVIKFRTLIGYLNLECYSVKRITKQHIMLPRNLGFDRLCT